MKVCLIFALLAVVVMGQGALPLDMSPLEPPVEAANMGNLADTCKNSAASPFVAQQCDEALEAIRKAQMEATQMQQARNSALKEKADAEKELKCYQDKKAEIDQQIQNVDQQKQEAQAAADEAIRAKLAADEAAVKAQHAADALKDSINNSPVRQEELKAAHDRAVKAMKDAEEIARALKATALTQQNEYKAATEELNKLTDELKPIADRLRKEYEEFKSAEANYKKEREDLLAATEIFRKQEEEAEAAARAANSERAKFANDNAAFEQQIAAQEKILKQLRELLGAAASFRAAQDRFNTAKSDLGVVTPPAAFWTSPVGLFLTAVIAGVVAHFLLAGNGKSASVVAVEAAPAAAAAVAASGAGGRATPRSRK